MRVSVRHPVLRESVFEPQVDVATRVLAMVVQCPDFCHLAGREHSQVRWNGFGGDRGQLVWHQGVLDLASLRSHSHSCSRLAHLCTLPGRCYYHWDVIAALRHNKSYDLFFSGYILICFGIVMEGIIRFCPHYFGSGMITLSMVVWVRASG